jgi:hypothetical protein
MLQVAKTGPPYAWDHNEQLLGIPGHTHIVIKLFYDRDPVVLTSSCIDFHMSSLPQTWKVLHIIVSQKEFEN